MDRKRPLDEDAEVSAAKRMKSSGAPSTVDLLAQKRAEIAAKFATMGLKAPGSATTAAKPARAPAPPPISLPAKPAVTPSVALPDPAELARRVAEAKRRVADATTKAAMSANPYIPPPTQGKKKIVSDVNVPQGTGLKMMAHPLLLDQAPAAAPTSKKDRYKPMLPKFASIKANARVAPSAPGPVSTEPVKANPYTSSGGPSAHEGFEGMPKERGGRNLRFNQKGKYIAQANHLRQEAQLEALKQRIAESARKAGLDSEFDVLEKTVRREPPPQVEWWDISLLANKTYEDVARGPSSLNIRNDDSPITMYVLHPIPLPPPGEKDKPAPKPLKLTTKEQKKLRKQRRAAELEDHRDRIRMGLIPPDPPKVRLANMMRVLTSDAVADPTKVEARVRRDAQLRKSAHIKMNEERKLTDTQRLQKVEEKRAMDEKKGLTGGLWRITNLSDPSHRFKITKNAQQDGLTGLCLIHPNFALVYAEGGAKGMKHYTRLLEHRVDWTQSATPGSDDEVDEEVRPAPDAGDGKTAGLAGNRCDLIWKGAISEHAFRNFKTKNVPTDNAAKELLGTKLGPWWDTAKNWKPSDEELYT